MLWLQYQMDSIMIAQFKTEPTVSIELDLHQARQLRDLLGALSTSAVVALKGCTRDHWSTSYKLVSQLHDLLSPEDKNETL